MARGWKVVIGLTGAYLAFELAMIFLFWPPLDLGTQLVRALIRTAIIGGLGAALYAGTKSVRKKADSNEDAP